MGACRLGYLVNFALRLGFRLLDRLPAHDPYRSAMQRACVFDFRQTVGLRKSRRAAEPERGLGFISSPQVNFVHGI